MKVKTHHVAVVFFVGAIVLASLAWLGTQASPAFATCSTGSTISVVAPPANTTLSGSLTLSATTSGSSTNPTDVTFIMTAPSQIVLGDVGASGSANANWSLSWDSRSIPDGSYQLAAIAHYGTNTTYDCMSASVPVSVLNSAPPTQSPTLAATLTPNTFQGVPGQQESFTVTGIYTDQFGTQHPITSTSGATFQWGTNAGSLQQTSTSPEATLTDGPTLGAFNVGVRVTMNGLTTPAMATVKIVAPTTSGDSTPSPTPSPSPTPPPPPTITTQDGTTTVTLTPDQVEALESMPTIFRPQQPTNSNPVVPVQTLGCLEVKLGSNFQKISAGQAQATTDDKLSAATCFSGTTKIPATLAPIDPTHITEVPQNTDLLTIASPTNETITSKSGQKITAILISGTGTPNSSIFLYIFSDPMVLRAQTDASGKWTYVLQDPLKPGHHEFYAVSQKDASNFVRTPAVPVSIAAASPGNQDGSLIIEHTWQPAQISYAGGSVLLVIAGLFLLFRLRRRHNRAATTAAGLIQPVTAPPAPPSQPSAPSQPAPASAPTPAPPAEGSHDSQT